MRRGQQQNPLDVNEEVDENFWARAAADRAEGDQALHQLGMYPLAFEATLTRTDDRWRR